MEEGHNTMGIKKKYKMTNNDLLHSTQKIISSITKPTE